MFKPTLHSLLALLLLLLSGRQPLRAGEAKGNPPDTAALEKQLRDAERQLRIAARQLAELHRQDAHKAGNEARKAEDEARRAGDEADKEVRIIKRGGPGERSRTVIVNGDDDDGNEGGNQEVRIIKKLAPRARLGVQVENGGDTQGAVIREVTPGSPAAEAGLKAGDIITGINGASLTGKGHDNEAPAQRLAALGRGFKPGEPVTVDFLRDGTARTVTARPRALPGGENRRVIIRRGGEGDEEREIEMPEMPEMAEMPEMPDMPELAEMAEMPEMPRMPQHGFMMMRGRMGGLELTRLEGELGDYFGVHEGLLVLRVPAKSGLPLKAGDVILQAGGKAVKNPHDLFHALHHGKSGDTVALEVQRHQHRETLNVKTPVAGLDRDVNFDFHLEAPEPPEPSEIEMLEELVVPPSPPSAPKAPRPPKAPTR